MKEKIDTEKINEIKIWFLGNINKMGKPLVRLTQKKIGGLSKLN